MSLKCLWLVKKRHMPTPLRWMIIRLLLSARAIPNVSRKSLNLQSAGASPPKVARATLRPNNAQTCLPCCRPCHKQGSISCVHLPAAKCANGCLTRRAKSNCELCLTRRSSLWSSVRAAGLRWWRRASPTRADRPERDAPRETLLTKFSRLRFKRSPQCFPGVLEVMHWRSKGQPRHGSRQQSRAPRCPRRETHPKWHLNRLPAEPRWTNPLVVLLALSAGHP
mmetsp:Transcript_6778/g.18959  ORF Transcript_6778/g.18959 Transcript_6778/m.18959 type:complete len:223 (-) Transcript_6778:1318-1986(-)